MNCHETGEMQKFATRVDAKTLAAVRAAAKESG
jgi:hypothetical protein